LRPRLPPELVDQILGYLIDSVDWDPAYTWTRLRHVSQRLKRRIEDEFEETWLPLMSVTLYAYALGRSDYVFEGLQAGDRDTAAFKNDFLSDKKWNVSRARGDV